MQVESINFEGKTFPARWTEIDGQNVLVSTNELGKAMLAPNGNFRNKEAIACPASCFVPKEQLLSMSNKDFAKFVEQYCYGIN